MKQPFRYFRGELNGKYLYALVICPNYAIRDVLDELVYHTLFQWKLDDEVDAGEMPIRDADIFNIAKIAGLFLPYSYGRSSYGSVYFTPSHVVNGQERSERGLFDMDTEIHRYARVEQDEYEDDIVNEATEALRASYVPSGFEPVGYLPYGKQLYTDDGEIIWENLLLEPPTDGTLYTEFYGRKFLTHEEIFYREGFLTIDVFKLLFECVQRIRYNGPTIAEFMEVTRILCAGYVYDVEIVPFGAFYTVYYRTAKYIGEVTDVANKDQRLFAWLYICAQKFKLFMPEERERQA